MEEAERGLGQLRILKEYPELVQEYNRLKLKVKEQQRTIESLLSRLRSLQETKTEVDEQANNLLDRIIAKRKDRKIRFTQEELKYIPTLEKKIHYIALEMRDATFTTLVKAESERKANERLVELKKVEWPRWFSRTANPKIEQLKAKINANVIKAIQGPWLMKCRVCCTEGKYTIPYWAVAQLIFVENIRLNCANQHCRNKIRVSLSDIIASYLGK